MDIKEEIKNIAKRLASGEKISDEELKDFMFRGRDYLMANAIFVDKSYIPSTKIGYFSPYNNPFGGAITSCSCGSRIDSCNECKDINGDLVFTSMFVFSEQGDIIRFKVVKDHLINH
jgi:hypothetical protein